MSEDQDRTNKALLDQLVYIDNFIGEDNELNFDLSAFADDSFIFADEEKPNNDKIDEMIRQDNKDEKKNIFEGMELNNLPRFPVPPGAKNQLQQAGLNQNQIDLLSALIAQYQLIQELNQPEAGSSSDMIQGSMDQINTHTTDQSLLNDMTLAFSTQTNHMFQPSILNSVDTEVGGSGSNVSGNGHEGYGTTHIRPSSTVGLQDIETNHYLNTDTNNSNSTPSSTSSTFNTDPPKMDNELDKRRRNTAASARFRIKKKLKEKQMEDKINNLQELIKNFENKIQTLELENKLLKNLIMDKGSEKSDQEFKMFKESILKKDRQDNN